jgi:hypothetical protein
MGVEVRNGPGLFTFFVASGIYPNPDLYDSKCIKGEVVFNFLADGKIPLNLKEVTVSNKITLNIANSTVRPDQYPRAFECQ